MMFRITLKGVKHFVCIQLACFLLDGEIGSQRGKFAALLVPTSEEMIITRGIRASGIFLPMFKILRTTLLSLPYLPSPWYWVSTARYCLQGWPLRRDQGMLHARHNELHNGSTTGHS